MIKITRGISQLMIAICGLMIIQMVGCGEDTDEVTEADKTDISEAPALPPDYSMMVDLSAFNEGQPMIPDIPVPDGAAQGGPGLTPPPTGENYVNAAARVVTINAAIASALTFPAGLFKMAKESEPVKQADGSWLWSYSVPYEIFEVDARLTGVPDGDKTYWSMKVSIDSPIVRVTGFEWYTGMSTETNTSGSWQFFDMFTPDEHNPTVKIDWSVELLQEKAELAIENIDTRGEYLGDVLLYDITPQTASMSFEDVSEGETWEIAWDIQTGEGNITVPNYNSGEKACWDAQKQDIVCN